MKNRRLQTILITGLLALSCSLPVYAQDVSTESTVPTTEQVDPTAAVSQPAMAVQSAAEETAEDGPFGQPEPEQVEAPLESPLEANSEALSYNPNRDENYVPSGAGEHEITGLRNFRWPVPSSTHLSSCFNDPMGHGSRHCAIDIVADYGASVTASYDGTVVAVRYNGNNDMGYGNSVVVLHEGVRLRDGSSIDLYTRYSHMSSISVSVGDTVQAGVTEVGCVGGTGSGYSPYSPHLDFQILYVDPSKEDSWSVPSKYSIDPFCNELLEMPDGFTASGGADAWCSCCYEYADYVKNLYQ